MRLDANNPVSLGALDNALRNAQEPSLDLFSQIINSACTRVQALGQALTHIVRLAEIGAWTEATFALIELELPLWTGPSPRLRKWRVAVLVVAAAEFADDI